LYFINREWFYAFMAMTKQAFALTITLMTHLWGPATIRISGDESVAGQILPTPGGGVEFKFPERMVMIANHQVRDERSRSRFAAKANHAPPDLHRLAVFVVDWVCQPSRDGWSHLHHPQRVIEIHPAHRDRHDVLWLHLHVKENGN
jgi:hypothetical protein